ncbi:uncharacterized protein PGTG_02007 [Puccinia graminis f. sp. tritici CRL 75-36-700-3]|uniref:Uncharacterized protein n=1 Tax=Puccinia graminis f. sp. tritici (strain CRL 75-36-700-3 / race SCCL) TaxID=418459 RepID=E3JWX1_PUCGT|nr:uncharacterized protein PGTG_02007 [Puccinia graminis f. sp. tritici CRL 75-36-700-3]EFP76546.1 hypothetical protein PGTG_02007 [Puccinia graminis f. sp. tritici CRL 75-36-700-3]
MSLCRWKPSWLCIAPDRPFAKALVLSINTGSVPPFSTSPHCTSPSLSFLSFFIPLIIHNYHYNLFTNLHHFYRVVFRALLFTVVIEKVLYPSFNQVATNCQDFQVLQSSIAISSSFPSPSPNNPSASSIQASQSSDLIGD